MGVYVLLQCGSFNNVCATHDKPGAIEECTLQSVHEELTKAVELMYGKHIRV